VLGLEVVVRKGDDGAGTSWGETRRGEDGEASLATLNLFICFVARPVMTCAERRVNYVEF
jgi:hypothetical protein